MNLAGMAGTALSEAGVRMHYYYYYYDAGSGTNALVLSGWPQTSWRWRRVIPTFAEAGYRGPGTPPAPGATRASPPTRAPGGGQPALAATISRS